LLAGQKKPLKPKHIWSIRVRVESHDPGATLSSLTWPSTASFAPATWSGKAPQFGIIVSDCQDVGTLRDQTPGNQRSRVARGTGGI
jgi:hypothetical protein